MKKLLPEPAWVDKQEQGAWTNGFCLTPSSCQTLSSSFARQWSVCSMPACWRGSLLVWASLLCSTWRQCWAASVCQGAAEGMRRRCSTGKEGWLLPCFYGRLILYSHHLIYICFYCLCFFPNCFLSSPLLDYDKCQLTFVFETRMHGKPLVQLLEKETTGKKQLWHDPVITPIREHISQL